MRMLGGLTGIHAIVHADIKPVRLETGQEPLPDFRHQIPNGRLLFTGQLVHAADVSARDHKRVVVRHAMGIGDAIACSLPIQQQRLGSSEQNEQMDI